MTFGIALSGLKAATNYLDVTANNIANVDTTGFKSSRTLFSDVYATANSDVTATTPGAGVQVSAVQQQFTQGNISFTNNNMDMAISGQGFFVVRGNEGVSYTRAGAFSVDNNGYVVNSANKKLQVFPVTSSGGFATGSLSDLQLQTTASAPKATGTAKIGLNLQADAVAPTVAFDPNVPSSYNNATSMTVYDSLGNAHTATMYFAKDAAATNTWNQYMYVDGNAVGGANQLTFNAAGKLSTPAGGTITYPAYDPANGAAPLNLNYDFSAASQYGQAFSVNSLTQDGYSTGRMTGISVDPTGVVSARFTNGQLTQLGKIALASFDNPNGLQQQGGTTWGETFGSGAARLGEAGTSNFGQIQSGALEGSNVDLTAQLVEMISAQRNFQANSQVIKTANDITQTIINMR